MMGELTTSQKESIRYYKKRYGEIAFQVFREYHGTCYYCGEQFDNLYDSGVQMEHPIPRAHEGETSLKNLIVACESCNILKSDMTPRKFKERLNKIFPGRIEEWPGDKIEVSFGKTWKEWQDKGIANESDETILEVSERLKQHCDKQTA